MAGYLTLRRKRCTPWSTPVATISWWRWSFLGRVKEIPTYYREVGTLFLFYIPRKKSEHLCI
ncbi:hypothetical protein GBAR_LOCUS6300 [Geodia barretti]|uniref:Uncharacterized protein n=1 Tax=Geodia barretti TaxID=519541 RepID=A0AA35W5Y3_GEOBA|nr:hypothetical protein GBAR_LOCUS6300 [Geodia barretti]